MSDREPLATRRPVLILQLLSSLVGLVMSAAYKDEL